MRRTLLALLLIVLGVVAALGIGALPVGAPYPDTVATARDGTREGIRYRIFVVSNGFHASIALPAHVMIDGAVPIEQALNIDMTDFPVDPAQVRHWLVGWGSQTAYTSLRRVRDLTPSIIGRALAFDVSVMHVQPLGVLEDTRPGIYAFDVSDAQLAALIDGLSRWFATSRPVAGITQGFGDRFYPGRGRFSAWHSCNTWVGRRLREAGIGAGLWTPIAPTLEFSLARASVAQAR